MKPIFLICLMLCFTTANGQEGFNISKVYEWSNDQITLNNKGDRYSEVWGVHINNRDFAILGSTEGTHIFDVTEPASSSYIHFIPAAEKGQGIRHRDYHDFNGFLYAVCDEGASTLQIIDLHHLPDSVSVVYDSDELFSRAHNIFIDSITEKLYVAGGEHGFSIYSLKDNPISPELLVIPPLNFSWWSQAIAPSRAGGLHDMYVRNDTVYGNTYDGFYIMDFTDYEMPIILSGNTNYPDQGNNHSGWLTDDGNTYITTDENSGKKIKLMDVSDPVNVSFIDTIGSTLSDLAIPHNPIVYKDYTFVSYYHDGLFVYNTKNPSNAYVEGFFDTSTETDYTRYKGAWGVYPFLGLDKILVSDMQNGLFVLDATKILQEPQKEELRIYPNPFDNYIVIEGLPKEEVYTVNVITLSGKVLVTNQVKNNASYNINLPLPEGLDKGCYVLKIFNDTFVSGIKIFKN